MSTGKTEKTWNISDTIQPIFIKLSPVSGHVILVTDYVENVGQGKIYKNAHFRSINISLKKIPNVKSR